jgi:hypothetical protein
MRLEHQAEQRAHGLDVSLADGFIAGQLFDRLKHILEHESGFLSDGLGQREVTCLCISLHL